MLYAVSFDHAKFVDVPPWRYGPSYARYIDGISHRWLSSHTLLGHVHHNGLRERVPHRTIALHERQMDRTLAILDR